MARSPTGSVTWPNPLPSRSPQGALQKELRAALHPFFDCDQFALQSYRVSVEESFAKMSAAAKTQSPSVAFRNAIDAFTRAKGARASLWPQVIAGFDAAFKAARHDRAAYTPRLNILEVFGLKTWELCHSRAISWFLGESESHEQGSAFMECLLRHCGVPGMSCAGYTVQREKPDRVDVVAYKRGAFAVFIENKVRHLERTEQFSDLQTSLIAFSKERQIPESHRIAVFLTDNGRRPTTAHEGPLDGFQTQNLRPIRRAALFNDFKETLMARPVKSELLTIFLGAYVDAISSHPGSDL